MPSQSTVRGKFGAQSSRLIRGPLAPVWSTSGTIGSNIVQGAAYSFQLVAVDDSGIAPTYALASGSLPSGVSLNSAGLVSGTPSAVGTFNFTVNATDENGRTSTSSTLTITVQSTLPTPAIWYKNSRVGQSPITNDGTLGSAYNSPANPSTTTDQGRNVWNMGSSYLEYPFTNMVPTSNNGNGWTIAAVLRNASNAKYSLIGAPTGSSQIVGSTGTGTTHVVAYNNDGYPFPGTSSMITGLDISSNMSQMVWRFRNDGIGQLTVWAPNRTSGPIYNNSLANNNNNNYGSAIDIQRVGWSRGGQDPTWYLVEYMLWFRNLTDAEVTQVRNYLGSTHPVGVVNN